MPVGGEILMNLLSGLYSPKPNPQFNPNGYDASNALLNTDEQGNMLDEHGNVIPQKKFDQKVDIANSPINPPGFLARAFSPQARADAETNLAYQTQPTFAQQARDTISGNMNQGTQDLLHKAGVIQALSPLEQQTVAGLGGLDPRSQEAEANYQAGNKAGLPTSNVAASIAGNQLITGTTPAHIKAANAEYGSEVPMFRKSGLESTIGLNAESDPMYQQRIATAIQNAAKTGATTSGTAYDQASLEKELAADKLQHASDYLDIQSGQRGGAGYEAGYTQLGNGMMINNTTGEITTSPARTFQQGMMQNAGGGTSTLTGPSGRAIVVPQSRSINLHPSIGSSQLPPPPNDFQGSGAGGSWSNAPLTHVDEINDLVQKAKEEHDAHGNSAAYGHMINQLHALHEQHSAPIPTVGHIGHKNILNY